MNWFQKILARVRSYFRRPELKPDPPKPIPPKPDPPKPDFRPEPPKPAPRPEPHKPELFRLASSFPQLPPPTLPYVRLSELEKERRKFDKFVEPQGPMPKPGAPRHHAKKESSPIEIPLDKITVVADQELFIRDIHHEDRTGAEVLYRETEGYGEFNFRDTILQQLERYFVYINRMRKHDPDAYGFYTQIGATLLPYMATNAHHRGETLTKGDHKKSDTPPLPAWFNAKRPGFGCFAYGIDPETEKYELDFKDPLKKKNRVWIPKFMYYTKYEQPPPEFQPMAGGDIYSMTVWWDRPHDPKNPRNYGVPQTFAVFISKDGTDVRALRQLKTKMVSIQKKRKNGSFVIPKRGWHFPSILEAEEGWAPEEQLVDLFVRSAQKQELAGYSMVRVFATKKNMTAVFGVNVHRMAYFFQDRDITLSETGSRKKVFHMVRAFTRKDGAHVPFHFRGERDFTWAGYQIHITVPGKDHPMMEEVSVGSVDTYWIDKKDAKRYTKLPEVGRILADSMGIKHKENKNEH
jgi:hypothetical protein